MKNFRYKLTVLLVLTFLLFIKKNSGCSEGCQDHYINWLMQAVALIQSRNYFQSDKPASICLCAENKKALGFHGEDIKLTVVNCAGDFV